MSVSVAGINRAQSEWRQIWCRLVLLALALWTCSGCSYFRLGHRSYDEIEEMNKEKQQEQKQFTPGTVFYTQ